MIYPRRLTTWFAGALAATLLLPVSAETLDEIVAVVDNDVIMASELDRQMTRVVQEARQRGADLPPTNMLAQDVLERLIMTRVQLSQATQFGITVDDNILNRAISNIANENGMSLSDFRATLENENIDFNQFREDIRQEIILSRLRQTQIDNKIFVTDREVDTYLANMSQQGKTAQEYHVLHILIATGEDADESDIEAAEEKANEILTSLKQGADFARTAIQNSDAGNASQGGDLGWMTGKDIPSLFQAAVTQMNKGDFEIIQNSSGFHIIKLQSTRHDEVHMVHQTHARHILIQPNELISDHDAERRLEQIKLRLESGEDFGEIARSHSDDNGSAVNGGDLGWVSPGDTVPEFEEVMNSLNDGEISDPFKSQFGWHVLQVLEHRDYDGTEELTRASARAAVKKRKTEEEFESWLIRLRDEAYVEVRI